MTFVSRCDTVNQLSMQIESSSDMAPIFSIKSCHNVKLHRHHALNVFKFKHWVELHFTFYCQAQGQTPNSKFSCQALFPDPSDNFIIRKQDMKIKSPTTYHINDYSGPYLLSVTKLYVQ